MCACALPRTSVTHERKRDIRAPETLDGVPCSQLGPCAVVVMDWDRLTNPDEVGRVVIPSDTLQAFLQQQQAATEEGSFAVLKEVWGRCLGVMLCVSSHSHTRASTHLFAVSLLLLLPLVRMYMHAACRVCGRAHAPFPPSSRNHVTVDDEELFVSGSVKLLISGSVNCAHVGISGWCACAGEGGLWQG